MSSIVLDLQQEVLKPDCDILNALRKAHLIASKLKLQEFDMWLQSELNGYSYRDQDKIPSYRKVKGTLKAFNPYNGWIPAQCSDDELEKMICEQKLWQPISELQELCQQNAEGTIVLQFPAGQMKAIASMFRTPVPMQFALHISQHLLKSIIELVKNCILEWTIRLESAGILGEGMRFSQEETAMAKKVPQTINNYYGTVVNGDIKQSQVVSGDHNNVSCNYQQAEDLIQQIKEAIQNEQISDEDRETADELITDVESKVVKQKKPAIIKAALNGLKDFLIGAGANVASALIVQYLQHGI